MSLVFILKRLGCWLLAAIVLCAPSSFSLSSKLLGDPQIDVWNHAWGYWFVFQSLLNGVLPFETDLIGAPGGGSIYCIDTPGAIAALPITAIFGAAVGYNVVLLLRLALSALAAQLLTEELSEKGVHSWIAGIGTLSLPFLLCELNNGISEVCAIQWGIFALWATACLLKRPSVRNALFVGLFQGLTITATFYYGLAIGLLLIFLLGKEIIHRSIIEKSVQKQLLIHSFIAAFCAIIVALPAGYAFWSSLESDSRLVLRDTSLNTQLLRHNAVDPRIFLYWGNFQSVNLFEKYGEPFVHTAYLRWSLFPFALWAGYQYKALRIWIATMFLSLLLGLGNYLWWGEEWLHIGDQIISLPFEWLRQMLPQIAITHPLRLSIGGQIICIVLAVIGWKELFHRFSIPRFTWGIIALFILTEGLFGSSASWPIHSSNASIPDYYQVSDQRGVLDLPAEAGTSMKTSQYFWLQSKHQRPIPYTPDARIGSTRDLETFKNFMGDGMSEQPGAISSSSALHIRNTYQLIAVHSDIDQDKAEQYKEIFTTAFGEGTQHGTDWVWTLEPLEESEELPQQNNTTSTPYSNSGEEPTPEISCHSPQELVLNIIQDPTNETLQQEQHTCGDSIAKYCIQRSKNSGISLKEALFCLDQFEKYHNPDNQYALMHLLRHSNTELKLAVAQKLHDLPLSRASLPKERLIQMSASESASVRDSFLLLTKY